MISLSVKLRVILVAGVLALFAFTEARGEDWVFYGGSGQEEIKESILRYWTVLSKLKPVPKTEAKTYHYYDRDSVAFNSPFPGGIVRVWEKFVLRKETKSYEETRDEVEKEEEMRLKRKLTALDYPSLFPLALNRATKEIRTLYEINCDSKELFIMEVNSYDKTGKRMSRDVNMDMALWFPIGPETVLDVLSKEVCKK